MSPVVLPYTPAGQSLQSSGVCAPYASLYVPSGQGAVQRALVNPLVEPYRPFGHSSQTWGLVALYGNKCVDNHCQVRCGRG